MRHFGHLSTDLAEIWYTFDLTLDQKSTNIFAKSVHRRPRKGVFGATYEGEKQQPKLKGRTLDMHQNFVTEWIGHTVLPASTSALSPLALHSCRIPYTPTFNILAQFSYIKFFISRCPPSLPDRGHRIFIKAIFYSTWEMCQNGTLPMRPTPLPLSFPLL